jgi:hypothetical protein
MAASVLSATAVAFMLALGARKELETSYFRCGGGPKVQGSDF